MFSTPMALNRHHPASTPPPPRSLNVQKFAESRAPELRSLHSIIANRLNSDFKTVRSKRRRTTSHDNRATKKNRYRKRRKLEGVQRGGGSSSGLEKDNGRKIPRRTRRRMEFAKNPSLGFSVSGDGTKRLRTHLWHAKRFQMTKRWGFYLPLGLQGRGKGSRALLRWLKSGALVHDASYYCAVQLEGPEESILKILRMVLVPSPSSFSELSESSFCGACHRRAMLHHVGAPDSRLIAPVTYMWRSFSRDHVDNIVEKDPIPNDHQSKESECRTSFCQLWVWIHAAAFDEGFNALSSACQTVVTRDGISISCSSLEGDLGKLEIMGLKAVQIFQKILHPISEVSNTSQDSQLRKCSSLENDAHSQLKEISIFEHLEYLPSYSILSLTVQDPRDISGEGIKDVPRAPSCLMSGQLAKDSKGPANLTSDDSNSNAEVSSLIWSNPIVSNFQFSSKSLWTSDDRMNPPMEESVLCMVKHQRRLAFFYLDNASSEPSTTKPEESSARSCPILLFKNNNQKGSYNGWSIILPLSWVKAFWIPLIANGARAIGLRERRWISSAGGLPSFPFDFPDCKAYTSFMVAEALELEKASDLRPLSMRPLEVPVAPPWDCVRVTIQEKSTRGEDVELLDTETDGTEMTHHSSMFTSDIGHHDAMPIGYSFQGFVARTSKVLTGYLNETHCGNLLLFPNSTIMGKNCFSELMDGGKIGWAPKRVNWLTGNRRLCFLRVLLHAYKEGVFEDGAVVCAPILTDLSLWITRSEEENRLHIPQHFIKSYFTKQESGTWKLQTPDDPANQQSFRWPIGFVTSGFVRGSTKPVAEAICEATLLAQLRGEQWGDMQGKGRPHIFVLVRNLKSTAYRLALATIVLEQQDDLEFM